MILWLAVSGCHDPTAPTEMPSAEAATGSVYDLGLTVTTEAGPVPLDRWRGKPLVVSMVYATCPDVCPLTIEAIRGIEARVPEPRRSEVRVLLVSLDPTDLPSELEKVALARGADPDRWSFATADEGVIRELAAALGVRYRALPDASISHSVVISLLGAEGTVVERVDGLGGSTSIDALVAALGGPDRTP